MNPDIKRIPHGLNYTPEDSRDFKLGAVFILPKLSDLPTEFDNLGQTTVRDQTERDPNNDKCTEYAIGVGDEIQEGVLTNPDFSFAVAKDMSGNPEDFGQDLRTACLGHIKVGAIEQSEVPQGINVDDPKYRYLKNWPPELLPKAFKHKKESLWLITGPYDAFDNIRASIYKFFKEGKKQPVFFGTTFGWYPYQTFMDEPTQFGFGHAMAIKGWVKRNGKEYLKVQQSLGTKAGENGFQYFSREVVNDAFPKYKAFMLIDMSREDAEWYINNNIKENDNWIRVFYKMFLSNKIFQLIREMFRVNKKTELVPNIPPIPPIEIPKEEPKPITLSKIDLFCLAIQQYEGWFVGSRSFKNNNPGNLRYVGQKEASGKDKDNFCIFPTYEIGFKVLKDMIIRAASGKSTVYNPNMTIERFFCVYAPSSDGNHPITYANAVAKKVGVPVSTPIKNLLV